jgi:hypothetical protein
MADEPFKATDKDWQRIEEVALNGWDRGRLDLRWDRTIHELRDRVAALEAERVAPEASTTAPTPPAAVPSGDELLRIWNDAPGGTKEGLRVVWDNGYQHGLAAGRAEQGGTPEPEPNQAPAGDGGLREVVKRTMRAQDLRGWDEVSRAVILAVAKWLRSRGNHYAATELEREAQR